MDEMAVHCFCNYVPGMICFARVNPASGPFTEPEIEADESIDGGVVAPSGFSCDASETNIEIAIGKKVGGVFFIIRRLCLVRKYFHKLNWP